MRPGSLIRLIDRLRQASRTRGIGGSHHNSLRRQISRRQNHAEQHHQPNPSGKSLDNVRNAHGLRRSRPRTEKTLPTNCWRISETKLSPETGPVKKNQPAKIHHPPHLPERGCVGPPTSRSNIRRPARPDPIRDSPGGLPPSSLVGTVRCAVRAAFSGATPSPVKHNRTTLINASPFPLGAWRLVLLWCLGFGAWCFSLPIRVNLRPSAVKSPFPAVPISRISRGSRLKTPIPFPSV